jgi:protein arginine kinase activator
MDCELCGHNEARVHVKQVIDGEVRELMVCEKCAAKSTLKGGCPLPVLTDFLFGVGLKQEPVAEDEDKVCGECHMRYSEFRESSLLGCPACYEAFRGDIAVMLAAMHYGDRHVGKVPDGERVSAEIERLRDRLSQVVAAQDFETAAELRDRLRELEAGKETLSETAGDGRVHAG